MSKNDFPRRAAARNGLEFENIQTGEGVFIAQRDISNFRGVGIEEIRNGVAGRVVRIRDCSDVACGPGREKRVFIPQHSLDSNRANE